MVEKKTAIVAGAGLLIFVGGVAFLVSHSGEVSRVDTRQAANTAMPTGGINPNLKTASTATAAATEMECYYVGQNYPNLFRIWLGPFDGQDGTYWFENSGGADADGSRKPVTIPGDTLNKWARNGKYYDNGDGLCRKEPLGRLENHRRSVPLAETRVVFQRT